MKSSSTKCREQSVHDVAKRSKGFAGRAVIVVLIIACIVLAVAGICFFLMRPPKEVREVRAVLTEVETKPFQGWVLDADLLYERIFKLGDAAIPELSRHAGDGNPNSIRLFVHGALIQMGPEGRKVFLQEAPNLSEDWVLRVFGQCRLTKEHPDIFFSLYEEASEPFRGVLYSRAIRGIKTIDPKVARQFIDAGFKGKDDHLLAYALRGVAALKPKDMEKRVEPYLKHADKRVRAAAVSAYLICVSGDPERKADFLVEVLKDPEPTIWRMADQRIEWNKGSDLKHWVEIAETLRTIIERPGSHAVYRIRLLPAKDQGPFLHYLIPLSADRSIRQTLVEAMPTLDQESFLKCAGVLHVNTPKLILENRPNLDPDTRSKVIQEFIKSLRSIEVKSDTSNLREQYLVACFKLVNGMTSPSVAFKRQIMDIADGWQKRTDIKHPSERIDYVRAQWGPLK